MSLDRDENKMFNNSLKIVEERNRRLRGILLRARKNVKDKIMNFLEHGAKTTDREIRLVRLYKEINQQLANMNVSASRAIETGFEENFFNTYYNNFFNFERELNIGTVGQSTGISYSVNAPLLKLEVIESALHSEIAGMTFLDRMAQERTRLQLLIRQEVAGAVTEGIPVKELEERFRKMNKHFKMTEASIQRTARTELLRAHSVAQERSDEIAQDQGLELTFIWDATLDGKTRPTHQNADGQKAKRDEDGEIYFMVGGVRMSGPRLGYRGSIPPAKEVVNCRCHRRSTIEAVRPRNRLARNYKTPEKWVKVNGDLTFKEWRRTEQGKEALRREKEARAERAKKRNQIKRVA